MTVTTRQACDWIASAPDRPSLTVLGYKSCPLAVRAPRPAPPTSIATVRRSRGPRPSTSPPRTSPPGFRSSTTPGTRPTRAFPMTSSCCGSPGLVSGHRRQRRAFSCSIETRVDRPARRDGRHLHQRQRLPSRTSTGSGPQTARCTKKASASRLLVRYPRLDPDSGRRVDEMTLNVDLAPTLLELIGQPGATEMQGLSVLGPLR